MTKKISIILLAFLTIILSLWIWSFTASKNSIVLGGSTSVNPFMQKMTKVYFDNGKTDFVYNSTGSQAGVGGVEKGMYAAGFVSKEISSDTLSTGNSFKNLACSNLQDSQVNECEITTPEDFNFIKKSIEDSYNEKPKNQSYIGLEFAIDAIGVIFNSPAYWSEVGETSKVSLNDLVDFGLKGEDDKLAQIYEGNYTWEDFGNRLIEDNKTNQNNYEDLQQKIDSNSSTPTKIVTFTREDGSGTRSAFSDLTGIKSMPKSNVVNSNGAMIENIGIAPSVGYVSNAFLSQLSTEGSVKLAGINGNKLAFGENGKPQQFKDGLWVDWNIEGIEEDEKNDYFITNIYEFKRPFVGIFNTYNNLEEILDFFEFMFIDNSSSLESDIESAQEVFKSEGLVKHFVFNPLPAL